MLKYLIFILLLNISCFASAQEDSLVCKGEVAITEHPYHLSFHVSGSFHCSAAVLSEHHAITTAHCLNKLPTNAPLTLRAGSANRYSGGSVHRVGSFVVHSMGLQYDYDVAILIVSDPFVLGPIVQPVTLPEQDEVLSVDDETTVTAWTLPWEVGADSVLEKLSIPIIDFSICDAIYLPHLMTDRMYCAGRVEGGNETCQVNAGSPMVIGDKLVGIMSFGSTAARPDYPSSYVKIGVVRGWINAATGV